MLLLESDAGVLNGTTDVDLVGAPVEGKRLRVSLLTIQNKDTASVTLTLLYDDNATQYQILKIALAADDTLFVSGLVLDRTDRKIVGKLAGAVSANEPEWTAHWEVGEKYPASFAPTFQVIDANGQVKSSWATAAFLKNVVEDTTPQLGGNLDLNAKDFIDSSGNEVIDFTETGSAVNHLGISNAATGNAPVIEAKGDNTNIDLEVKGKGTGRPYLPGGAYFGEDELTDGATIDWNVQASPAAKVTLGGNRTMNAPTNLKAGQTYALRVIQDATGSRTLTWNSVFKWAGGTAPTLSTGANAVDLITFYCDGTNLYGASVLNLS